MFAWRLLFLVPWYVKELLTGGNEKSGGGHEGGRELGACRESEGEGGEGRRRDGKAREKGRDEGGTRGKDKGETRGQGRVDEGRQD
jgi:hypothetical protein